MKREFKEESFKLLTRLEQESKIPENTILGKSVLDSAQGERVWLLLKTLSDSAMRCEIAAVSLPYFQNLQNYIQNPAAAVRSSVMRMKRSMSTHVRLLAEEFNSRAQVFSGKQAQWTEHARYLTTEHRLLRNTYDELGSSRKKKESGTSMIEKLAALDRIPQIDMLRYIWKNIENLVQASSNRKGEIHVRQVVEAGDRSEPQKIHGNVQGNLKTWGAGLENISDKLETGSSAEGIQHFALQLRTAISAYKPSQISQLDCLKSHRDSLKAELLRLAAPASPSPS